MHLDLAQLERFTIDVARDTGRLLMRYRHRSGFSSKADGSVQTAADVAAEALVRRRVSVAYPGAAFLGEESYGPVRTDGLLWVCDPLDGTTNYLRGHPIWGVSLAAFQNGEPLVGVVHLPLLRETFWAVAGRGTRRNGAEVRVAEGDGTQFSDIYTLSSRCWGDYAVEGMASSLRCFGSCAYHLAQLSCGGTVGCWEYNPKIWDLAAGVLLVREAGGTVRLMDGGDPIRRFAGSPERPGQALPTVAACNERVLARMMQGTK
ncbi:MAG: inositol monophosphatase [Bacteroidetes bacterium]|nr:inositol monophosphatase [Bacteroidota bacterium]MCL5025710.1 inositol monophosphatase [Chloroflexota bacterium]